MASRRALALVSATAVAGTIAIWGARNPLRHAGAPAAAANPRVVVTGGPHDVSAPLGDIDRRAAALDSCAGSSACESEAEREEAEREGVGNSAGHRSDVPPVAFASVPDGGAVEQTSFGPRAPLQTVATFNSGLNGALDNNIAVGPNNLVAMINSRFQVMTKAGAVTFGPVNNNSIFSGFAGGVCANSGDGHVQYDQLARRWLFTQPNFSSGFWICYAVSTTTDPTGPYYRYAFPRPLFPDYPRVAVWPDGYYTTTSTGDNVIEKTACVVDRAKMLAGLTATQQCVTVQNVSFMEPANVDGQALPPPGAPELIFAAGGAQLDGVLQDDGLYVYKFHVDWDAPVNTTFTGPAKIAVAPYSFLCGGQLVSCVPQPGSTTRLDAQGDKIMHRAAYRNVNGVESIVLQHSINTSIGGGGPRWYELRLDASRNPQVYQQSTYAPDARYRWMGSIGMDRKGDIAMGFSYGGGPYALPMTTSSCVPPACDRVGVRFTARQAGDPPGVMTYADGVIAAGVSSSTGGSNRWEDWSVLALDPTDDCTFWYNGGYMPAGATTYNGRIGAWRLPNCRLDGAGAVSPSIPLGPFSGIVATFTDSDLTATPGIFSAVIDWGDGSTSPGTVEGGSGSFSVTGSHAYAGSGQRAIATTITGSEGSTTAAVSNVVVGNGASYPTASILQPLSTTTWSVGDVISFSATATDNEDGPLGDAAMTWTLILHDCPSSCTDSTLGTRAGVSSGTFTAPSAGYPSNIELRLTATDTTGLQTTASVTIQPRTVNLTFASVPPGLQLTVGSSAGTAPFSRTVIVGSANAVTAASPQGGYQFASWSDGGSQVHTIAAPPDATTYTATFTAPQGGGAIGINFVGNGTSMGSAESAGPVLKTNWNNATGASRTTALALRDDAGLATATSVTWTSNGTWSTPITDTAGNKRLMKGYLDSGNATTTTVTVSGVSGTLDVYVLADGSNGTATRTGTYQISGPGIATSAVTLTDAAGTNFNTTFTQASNSAGNYVKFRITATSGFTVTATPGTSTDSIRRAPVNGVQIVPAGPPPPDTTAPTVSLSAPAPGTISGTVSLTASATDNVGVASVQFKRDGVDIGSPDTAAPYQVAWDTTGVGNGPYALTAIARDAAGNEKISNPVAVTVMNDLVAPSVSITSPGVGATVGGTVLVTANATDDIGVTSVQFALNGANLGAADAVAPYEVAWNTTGLANGGPYTLTAVARDAANRQTTSAPLGVTVFNAPPPPDTTPPTVSLTTPSGGTVSGSITVAANASDNAGVANVQFRLNGADLGAPDTSAPYSVVWNTTTSPNGGPYALTAVATDTSGYSTTSAAVNVNVSNVAATGLVAAYGFNENAGATAADATGNGRTGTIANAAWTAAGKFGAALTFNGSSATVSVADHNSLDLTTGMTLEAWVYPLALSGWPTVMMKETAGGLIYVLYANGTASRPATYIKVGSSDYAAAGSAQLPLNTWSHLAATYDGVTLRTYVNGALVGSQSISGSIAVSTGALRIGGNQVWGEYFNGRLDEVRIYNRALSATEIQHDMTTPVGGGV